MTGAEPPPVLPPGATGSPPAATPQSPPPGASGAPPSGTTRPDIGLEQVLRVYEVFRDYLKHEDDLRSTRTGWLLTAQAFLFAGAATLVSGKSIHERALYVLIFIAILGLAVAINHRQRSRLQDNVYLSLEEEYRKVGTWLSQAAASPLSLDDLPALRYAGDKPTGGAGRPGKPYSVSYHTVFIWAWIIVLCFAGCMIAHRHRIF